MLGVILEIAGVPSQNCRNTVNVELSFRETEIRDGTGERDTEATRQILWKLPLDPAAEHKRRLDVVIEVVLIET